MCKDSGSLDSRSCDRTTAVPFRPTSPPMDSGVKCALISLTRFDAVHQRSVPSGSGRSYTPDIHRVHGTETDSGRTAPVRMPGNAVGHHRKSSTNVGAPHSPDHGTRATPNPKRYRDQAQ